MSNNIKAFLEADALRTRGEWYNVSGDEPYAGIKIMSGRKVIAKLWLDDAPVHDFNAEQSNNAAFIAAASRIAPDIRAMEDAFERVCEALEFYRDNWQGNADGAMDGTPGLTRTWQEPNEALWNDEGRKAHQILTAAAPFLKTGGVSG